VAPTSDERAIHEVVHRVADQDQTPIDVSDSDVLRKARVIVNQQIRRAGCRLPEPSAGELLLDLHADMFVKEAIVVEPEDRRWRMHWRDPKRGDTGEDRARALGTNGYE